MVKSYIIYYYSQWQLAYLPGSYGDKSLVEEVYKKMNDLNIYVWDEWVDFCEFYKEDPYEICDYSFDLGGGDTFDIEYSGDVPKREEE